MEREKAKLSKRMKKVISTLLVTALTLGSIPAGTFLGEALDVHAEADYSPQKLGVGVMCNDLTSGGNADKIYKALVRTNSKSEDSSNGSIYNNIGMLGYKYSASRAGCILRKSAEKISGALQAGQSEADPAGSHGVHHK